MSGGVGFTYNFNNFFTFTSIAGCILNCNYGDICGTTSTISGTDISVTFADNPWEINAKNIIKKGYE